MANRIPLALIYFRLLAGIIIYLLAMIFGIPAVPWMTALVLMGFISDILDGIIARKLGVSTLELRKLDSIIDRIFWFLILAACWLLYPHFIASKVILILIVVTLEGIVYALSLAKFNKIPSPHNFLSKLWGITIVLTLTEIVLTGSSSFLFNSMIIVGVISRVDSLMIHILLKKWDHDIPSLYHAYLLRIGKSFRRSELLNG